MWRARAVGRHHEHRRTPLVFFGVELVDHDRDPLPVRRDCELRRRREVVKRLGLQ